MLSVADEPITRGPRPRRYLRTTDPVEFSRTVAFSDGVFAIAMTLLVVTVNLPVHTSDKSLGHDLRELLPQVLAFFLSFAVIGRYWLAHHRFVGLVDGVNTRFLVWTLVYLAMIAFLPFSTAVFGDHPSVHAAVVLYAVNVAVISTLEVVLFVTAVRDGLFRHKLPPDVYRYSIGASLVPVAAFLLSIPVGLFSSEGAIAMWIATFASQPIVHRFKPPGADDYLS